MLMLILNYYFAAFLRLAKNKPAAMIMIAHPPIVKIVVPIPPVDGRFASCVFLNPNGLEAVSGVFINSVSPVVEL